MKNVAFTFDDYVNAARLDLAHAPFEQFDIGLHVQTGFATLATWCEQSGLPSPPMPLPGRFDPDLQDRVADFATFSEADKEAYVSWSNRIMHFRIHELSKVQEEEARQRFEADPATQAEYWQMMDESAAEYGMEAEEYEREVNAANAYFDALDFLSDDDRSAHYRAYFKHLKRGGRIADFIERHGIQQQPN
jgi:hypothetical protein